MGRMAVVNLASDDSVGRECTFPEFPCLIRNSDLVLQFCCDHSAGRVSHTTQALLPWRQADQNSCLGDAFINMLNAKGGWGLMCNLLIAYWFEGLYFVTGCLQQSPVALINSEYNTALCPKLHTSVSILMYAVHLFGCPKPHTALLHLLGVSMFLNCHFFFVFNYFCFVFMVKQ